MTARSSRVVDCDAREKQPRALLRQLAQKAWEAELDDTLLTIAHTNPKALLAVAGKNGFQFSLLVSIFIPIHLRLNALACTPAGRTGIGSSGFSSL